MNVTPIAYVNGAYVPLHDARILLLDRAALFADAVYEVMWIEQGRLIDFDNHWRRFVTSAHAIAMKPPYTKDVWHKNDRVVLLAPTRAIKDVERLFTAKPSFF